MHSSLVRAIYKGQMRGLSRQGQQYLDRVSRTAGTPPRSRKAWTKWVLSHLLGDPNTLLLDIADIGKSMKQGRVVIVTLTVNDANHWVVVSWSVDRRRFTITDAQLPLTITDHVVERIMKRENITDVREALVFLAPSIGAAVATMRHPDDQVLLPCGSGAVVSKRDTKDPQHRALVTYIDSSLLTDRQRRALADMDDFARQEIKKASLRLERAT